MRTNKELRLIYMGTPEFAVRPLQELIHQGYNVVAVVTNPDKPAGRGQALQPSPVKEYALSVGLPILQPEKFRDEAFLKQLAAYRADLQIVVAFKMLPEVVWNMPPMGTVNVHTSLLPRYRGAAPINWAVINGEKESGVSTFLLKHEIDTGNIILQTSVSISDDMNAGELHDILMEKGARILCDTIDLLASGNVKTIKQDELPDEDKSKHAPKLFKQDMKIDWTKPVQSIHNLVRGLSPYPAAWFEFIEKESGKSIACKLFTTAKFIAEHNEPFGKIATDKKSYLRIFVDGGYLELLELQLAGKKRMKIDEFLRGFKIEHYTVQ